MAAAPTSGGIISVEGFENIASFECLARFAVNDYNENQNELFLEFKNVLEAKRGGAGVYSIILEALNFNENKNKVYKAKVLARTWQSKRVTGFEAVIPN